MMKTKPSHTPGTIQAVVERERRRDWHRGRSHALRDEQAPGRIASREISHRTRPAGNAVTQAATGCSQAQLEGQGRAMGMRVRETERHEVLC